MTRAFACIVFTLSGLLIATPCAHARYFNTVVIDPGHGAHDFGCRDRYCLEKHLALDISRRLERYMLRKGYRTIMTRNRDQFVALDRRAGIANNYSRSVFISIHVNDARRSGASGVETFFYNREGAVLAQLVQRQLLSRTDNGGNRGVKFARFRVLRLSARPSILVESGFISNPRDRARLRDPSYREAVARSIALGVQQYRRH